MATLAEVLARLEATIAERKASGAEGSYTVKLLADPSLAAKKLGEEAVETVIAALTGDRDAFIGETSDLVYHLLVLLLDCGVEPGEIARKLLSRHQGASP